MGFFLFILLILFLLVGWPLLKGWLYYRSLRQRVHETFGGRRERKPSYREEEYTETGDRKIYGSGEGEYAEYEELSGTVIEETTANGDTRTVIEEQVIDAEFEEV